MFVWQIPHVYAIAMLYRDDYERGGLKMLPQSGRASGAAGHVAAWSIALIAASLAPAAAGMAGGGYALCAIALGTLFAYYAFCFWGEPSTGHARRVLVASVAYLPAVLVLVLLDSVGRGL
jgi:protoheme IX farnesyltransferase